MVKNTNELENSLRKNGLHETVAHLVDVIGFENAWRLVEAFGGTELYIPKKDTQLIPIRDAQIHKEFDGSNYKALATKYGLSEKRVRNIINLINKKGREPKSR